MDDKELIKRIMEEVKDEKLREKLLALVVEENKKKDDTKQEEEKKDDTKQEEEKKDDTKQEKEKKDDTEQEEEKKDDTEQEEEKKDDTKQEEEKKDDTKQEEKRLIDYLAKLEILGRATEELAKVSWWIAYIVFIVFVLVGSLGLLGLLGYFLTPANERSGHKEVFFVSFPIMFITGLAGIFALRNCKKGV